MLTPRVRFTVLGLIILIVVLSLAMWIAVLLQRRSKFLRTAQEWREVAELAKDDLEGRGPGSALGVDPEESRTLYAYYDRLTRKYEYAAAHPWLSIDPDPPNPLAGLPIPLEPPAPKPDSIR
jgi:hypothetical protein